MQKFVLYSATLIGVYLAVSHATGGGKLITAAGNAGSKYVKTLQGR